MNDGNLPQPGNRIFQRAISDRFYVDKTALVSFMNRRFGMDSGFVDASRPRRFGKSMDANMLCAYYSCGCDSRAVREPYRELGFHLRGAP